MSKENFDKLKARYPKLYRNLEYFEVGKGWYDIIEIMSDQIYYLLKSRRDEIARYILFNRALSKALNTDSIIPLEKYYRKYLPYSSEGAITDKAKESFGNATFKVIDRKFADVYFEQIKEKFGTLRIYSTGDWNPTINGIIIMAEAMSTRICETCGKPGTSRSFRGWLETTCEEHKRK